MMYKLWIGISVVLVLLVGCNSSPSDDEYDTNNTKVDTQVTEDVYATQPIETVDTEVVDTEPSVIVEPDVEDGTVEFYISKLKDPTYISQYGDEQEAKIWYTAAEALGEFGKPAIPALIEVLGTTDPYEKGLALYALLLATQHENVSVFTNGEYINVNLSFLPEEQVEYEAVARTWWNQYKENFE